MGKNLPHSPSSKPRFSLAAGNSQANLFPALEISGAVQPAVGLSPWGVEAPGVPGARGPFCWVRSAAGREPGSCQKKLICGGEGK